MAPPVRFQGFTEPWEQRKLGEIADRITRKNTNLEATRPLTISAKYGLIDQSDFLTRELRAKISVDIILLKMESLHITKVLQ